MQEEFMKNIATEISKQAVSTERILKDVLADPDFTEIIPMAVDARVQSTADQNLTENCVQNAIKDLISTEKFIKGITKTL